MDSQAILPFAQGPSPQLLALCLLLQLLDAEGRPRPELAAALGDAAGEFSALLNGDGRSDLILLARRRGSPVVYFQNARGGFGQARIVRPDSRPALSDCVDVEVADLDGDGHAELVLKLDEWHDDSVKVWREDGARGFQLLDSLTVGRGRLALRQLPEGPRLLIDPYLETEDRSLLASGFPFDEAPLCCASRRGGSAARVFQR